MKSIDKSYASSADNTIFLHDHAVVLKTEEPVSFEAIKIVYDLLSQQIEISDALELDLKKANCEIEYLKKRNSQLALSLRTYTSLDLFNQIQ